MRIARTKAELSGALRGCAATGRTIGLVPTMGYLHGGHLSFLRAARERCDVVVMSLFVNPAQFGPGEDLDAIRETRRAMSRSPRAGVDLVYAPPVDEVYPEGFATSVEVGAGLTEVSTATRPRGPEHFRGVTTWSRSCSTRSGPTSPSSARRTLSRRS